MSLLEEQYLNLCRHILDEEETREDRTGLGTKPIFSTHLSCDLRDGFPLLKDVLEIHST